MGARWRKYLLCTNLGSTINYHEWWIVRCNTILWVRPEIPLVCHFHLQIRWPLLGNYVNRQTALSPSATDCVRTHGKRENEKSSMKTWPFPHHRCTQILPNAMQPVQLRSQAGNQVKYESRNCMCVRLKRSLSGRTGNYKRIKARHRRKPT